MSHPGPAFQDSLPDIHCFGCGPDNDRGLRIKSFWSGPGEAVCRFTPAPHHCAGPVHIVNGGIIATLIDCHAVGTAMADAYGRAGRDVGEGEAILYATGKLSVTYLAPTPMGVDLVIRAVVADAGERKTTLRCTVEASGRVTAEGEVVAVRVPAAWREPDAKARGGQIDD